MSQHDLVINNDSGINVRLDINSAIQALGTLMLGSVAPSPTYPCELWADTTTQKIWIRNSANTAWLQFGKLDVATSGGIPAGGTTGQHLAKNSNTDGDVLWSTPNYLPLTGGTVGGNLTVTGATLLQGTVTTQAASGGNAFQWFTVVSTRSWLMGTDNAGNFVWNDQTAASTRMFITPAGVLNVGFGMTVGGTASFSGSMTLSGPSFSTVSGFVQSQADFGLRIVTPSNATHARFYSVVSGVRAWSMGALNDGAFHIRDESTPRDCFSIDSGGNVNVGVQLQVPTLVVTSSQTITRPAGNYSVLYFQTVGQDQYYIGEGSAGDFYLVDVTTSVIPWTFNKAGGFMSLVATKVGGVGIMYPGVGGGEWYAMAGWASGHFTLYMNGSAMGTITPVTSDVRYKENLGPPEGDALADVNALELYSYDVPDRAFPENPSWHVTMGFSAQQMSTVIPEAVHATPEKPDAERDLEKDPYTPDELMLAFDTMPVLARCVAAIQQLTARIEVLEGTPSTKPN